MIRISDEVEAALEAGGAVVALESTLVAHGLPWPENLEVGRALEAAVRSEGALPATVAVIAGTLTVGLSAAELERVARGGFRKAGQADLAPAIAGGLDAATTVSATTFAAARAGIALFATGGIGGVHRGDGGDVSSDLTTMAREPVAIVSAGAKAILDLPRTLEMLETLGVLVVGFGTDELPAFYSRRSGLRLEHRVDDAAAAARLIATRRALGDRGGVLIANPIPEADALPDELITRAVSAALDAAARAGVSGKALTPFLLRAIAEQTGARSLAANRALVLHNGVVAARVARALAELSLAPRKHLLTVAVGDPSALLTFLAARLRVDRAVAAAWVRLGAVSVDGRRADAATPLCTGAKVVAREPPAASISDEEPALRVVHRDDDLLVIDKPAGMLAQPSPNEAASSLEALVQRELTSARLMHRLDRAASGLTLFALRPGAIAALQRDLERGTVERRYCAVAAGVVASAQEIRLRIARDPVDARRRVALPERASGGDAARTRVVPVGRRGAGTVLSVELHSGRTHQIRVHLAAIGHPLVGDALYGGPPAERLLLHAEELAFAHPSTGVRVLLVAPAPPGFAAT